MKREILQTTRDRRLTPEEAAKYRRIRVEIEAEKQEYVAWIRGFMTALQDALGRVLAQHDLACGAVLNPAGTIVAQSGDAQAFSSDGLLQGLLGPYGDAATTVKSLDGQILPRIWRQGEELAVLDKFRDKLTVVVFGRSPPDVSADWQLAQAIRESVRRELASMEEGD